MSVPSPCRSSGAHGSVRLIHRAPLPDGQQVWLCVACQGSASIYHFADAKNGGGVVTREWLCLALELSVANWPLTGPNSQEYASPRGHPWGAGPDNAQSSVGERPDALSWASPDTMRKRDFGEEGFCQQAVIDS